MQVMKPPIQYNIYFREKKEFLEDINDSLQNGKYQKHINENRITIDTNDYPSYQKSDTGKQT